MEQQRTAPLPPALRVRVEQYTREHDLARELNVSVRTLRRWHVERHGPVRTKIGKAIWYSRKGLEEWLLSNAQQTTQPGRRRKAVR